VTVTPVNRLAGALVEAQKEMPAVAKDGTNPHFKSKFVSLDNLIEKTRPVLNKHGLAIVQFPSVSELGAPTLRTILVHSESGEQLSADMPLFLAGQDMQKYGAALTYARRYAWAAALGIASDEDDDGNTAATPSQNAHNAQPAAAHLISDAQRRRLFALAKEADVGNDDLKTLIFQVTAQGSTNHIPVDKYDELCALLEAQKVPF
jgi:hypothetical protein